MLRKQKESRMPPRLPSTVLQFLLICFLEDSAAALRFAFMVVDRFTVNSSGEETIFPKNKCRLVIKITLLVVVIVLY